MATVLRSVAGRISGQQAEARADGTDGKLLQMADRDDAATEEPTPSTQRGAEDEAMEDPNLASLITQVNTRDQQAAPVPAAVQYAGEPGEEEGGSGDVRSTWKNKFR
mgnify:CR=1 FL=1